MFKFYLYKLGEFIVNALPLTIAYRFAVILSDFQYRFSPRDRRFVRNNLRLILNNPQDLETKVREVFRNFGLYLVEFFRMSRTLNDDFIKKNVRIKNLDRIHEVLKKGDGAILITAHVGNWELGGAILSHLGYKILVIALPHKERPVNDLFNLQREIHGITVVAPHLAGRKCIETLKANGLIALLSDRDFTQHGFPQPFFGKTASIPKGAALFSHKTQAPIIPMIFTRAPDGLFDLEVWEPIDPVQYTDSLDSKESWQKILAAYTLIIEKMIKEHPTQWLMFREFWIK